jgi:hypothetical protein
MNGRSFGCPRCKTYTDAGYRWAYWLLEEPGIVAIGKSVSVDAVTATAKYWNPPPEEQSDWLVKQILPQVRRYLAAHGDHGLIYIEDDMVFDPDGACADWEEEKSTKLVLPRGE